ncbi:MAG: hypothetical protein FWD91_05185, partial [Treponema sp.]|nr:hypothetical protein [Treponema sp.]
MKYTRRIGLSLRLLLSVLLFVCVCLSNGFAVDPLPLPDSAAATRYAQWAQGIIAQGQWQQALAGLERAADFADVSSDVSYLLALARSNQKQSRSSVLQALDKALFVNRWNLYTVEDARLMRVENLIAVRAFHQALLELSFVRESPRSAALALRTMAAAKQAGVISSAEFFVRIKQALDRYPRETELARIFFTFLLHEHRAGNLPDENQLELLELVMRRLPALIDTDAELGWMAAPFAWDTEDARRLILAYRASHTVAPQSIPVSLRLGVIGEERAVQELFDSAARTGGTLDRGLMDELWELLRDEAAISLFTRNLSAFSGVITEDTNRDGIPEVAAEFFQGMLIRFTYDATQDGDPCLIVFFEGGTPHRAHTMLMPERGEAGRTALIRWERFPAILDVELDGVKYIPRPFDFHYSPFVFDNLWGSGVLFPTHAPNVSLLTRRTLVFNALRIERSSSEFSGGIEVIELNQGVPLSAREYVGELLVSETEFSKGRPQTQLVDLALSGRMTILRRFAAGANSIEPEDLWDYRREVESIVPIDY